MTSLQGSIRSSGLSVGIGKVRYVIYINGGFEVTAGYRRVTPGLKESLQISKVTSG